MHKKQQFNLFDFFGAIGGVFELFKNIVGFLLYPCARFSYIISVLEKTFDVQTVKVFARAKNEEVKEEKESSCGSLKLDDSKDDMTDHPDKMQ